MNNDLSGVLVSNFHPGRRQMTMCWSEVAATSEEEVRYGQLSPQESYCGTSRLRARQELAVVSK